jgi:putative ABC transport system ATP-binding protein
VRRKLWGPAAVLTAAAAAVMSSAQSATPTPHDAPANTAKVDKGRLSAMVSQGGILTYRARSDGSPYAVINQARGVYTELPENGDRIGCGHVLYRVDDKPVVLLCGTVPAYRDLHTGDTGRDVRQLNRNLRRLGYDADIDPGENDFTAKTSKALKALQHDTGSRATGALAIGGAVFLPEPVRVAGVTGELGGSARPGAPVLNATSGKLHVEVALDPSQQGAVKPGDRAQITLPGNTPASGRVEGFGRVSEEPVLDLDAVTKVYGEQPPVAALRGVSFSVARGELVAIVGPSGSGKSTLLHVMGTLERPTGGVLRIGGVDAAQLDDRELSRLRALEIGFVFQQFFLAEHATVRENVADGLLYAGVPAAERYTRADEALERVGVSHRSTFKPTTLSGGERQRVAIARALVGRPAIVLADEPTGNLDSTTGASIMALIRGLNAAGATILMITHDAGLAEQLPRQIALLDGHVVSDTGRHRA